MITVDVKPVGKRKVVLTFEQTDQKADLGVHELIKCMAHYIKMLISEHQIPYAEVNVTDTDQVTILPVPTTGKTKEP